MLTLVSKRLVTKLTGFAFVLAIVAAMGVGVFSPASTDAASSAQSPDQLIEWQAPQVFGWEGISTTEAASPARFSSSYFNPVEWQVLPRLYWGPYYCIDVIYGNYHDGNGWVVISIQWICR